jgi:hypothetical protein
LKALGLGFKSINKEKAETANGNKALMMRRNISRGVTGVFGRSQAARGNQGCCLA